MHPPKQTVECFFFCFFCFFLGKMNQRHRKAHVNTKMDIHKRAHTCSCTARADRHLRGRCSCFPKLSRDALRSRSSATQILLKPTYWPRCQQEFDPSRGFSLISSDMIFLSSSSLPSFTTFSSSVSFFSLLLTYSKRSSSPQPWGTLCWD